MSSAVIVGFKRSPFTIAKKGKLSNVRPEDILPQVINDLIKSTNININDKSFSYYPPSIYKTKINRNINILDEIFKYQKQFPTNRYSDKKQIKHSPLLH